MELSESLSSLSGKVTVVTVVTTSAAVNTHTPLAAAHICQNLINRLPDDLWTNGNLFVASSLHFPGVLGFHETLA